MKCINPVLVHINEQGNRIFRHFNLATAFIKNNSSPFNCGSCLVCRKRNSLELAQKCVLHASLYPDNCFLTLTYNQSHIGNGILNYSDIQNLKKRLRKHISKTSDKKIQIFNVHEYGKLGRKHWHLVIFNHDFDDKKLYTTKNGIPLYTSEILTTLWPYGFNTVGNVTEASAMYQAQYTQKDIKNGNTNNSKKAKSNHSGIGKPFFFIHYRQILSLGYIPFGNKKMSIPRSFEKLAHKHWCHFHDQTAFFPTTTRKSHYTPFKIGQENEEISNLYIKYKEKKQLIIKELGLEWDELMNIHTDENNTPDFIKSGVNLLHDMKSKDITLKEIF